MKTPRLPAARLAVVAALTLAATAAAGPAREAPVHAERPALLAWLGEILAPIFAPAPPGPAETNSASEAPPAGQDAGPMSDPNG